jgi:outer membrane protein assembly factor BamB
MHNRATILASGIAHLAAWAPSAPAADRPQWGERHARNMVSAESGLPDRFTAGVKGADGGVEPATAENVTWVARLGTRTYGTPVVAEGKVLIGTNNGAPRDPRIDGDRGVLMCFDEKTGRFLWQLALPKKSEVVHWDTPLVGITSPPTIEDGRAYVVSNRGEVLCLDLHGMADGNAGPFRDEGRLMASKGEAPLEPGPADADILWRYDIPAELGVRQHDSNPCSILIDGDLLYVGTANGVDVPHTKVPKPDAPALIVLDKRSGRLVARDGFGVGPRILHGQWSSPALGRVDGGPRVFFGAGNGCVYAAPAWDRADNAAPIGRLEIAWSFNGQPVTEAGVEAPFAFGHGSKTYEVVGTPVIDRGRLYVALTQDPWLGGKKGRLVCLDAAGSGDVTRSGLVWSYDHISQSISTISIAGGLVFLADHAGTVHCLDAETGEPYWAHPTEGPIWGSTLAADGKVYVGNERRLVWVLAAEKRLRVISRIAVHDPILGTPVAANGTLYLATCKHLYAIGRKQRNADKQRAAKPQPK